MAVSKEAMYKQLTQDEISAGVEPTSLTMDDFLIEANFRMQVTGPSMSGKSSFIANLIKFRDQVFKSDFTRIVYCCPSRTYKSITYIEQLKEYCPFLEVTYGLPNVGELQAGDQTLVIMDDMAAQLMNSVDIRELFIRISHHCNVSIIFTAQLFFVKTTRGRDIPTQVTHHVLFPMPGEGATLGLLSKKYGPNHRTDVLEKIFALLQVQFGCKGDRYVLIDFHTDKHIEPMLTFRSQIFPQLWIDGTMQLMPILYKII